MKRQPRAVLPRISRIPGDRRAEAEELLECAAGRPIASDELVEGAVLARFRRLTARRVAGEPLEYLTGQATVRDMKLQVGRGAFIPRDSSGFLADVAIERANERPTPIVVDVCTGVGPVALLCAAGLTRMPPCTDWTSRRRPSRSPGGTLAP